MGLVGYHQMDQHIHNEIPEEQGEKKGQKEYLNT